MQFKKMLIILTAACFISCSCSETKKVENISPESEDIQEIQQIEETKPLSEDPLTSTVRIETLDLGVQHVGASEMFITSDGYGVFLFPESPLDISFAEYTSDFELKSNNKLTLPAPQDDYYYIDGLYTYNDGVAYSLARMEWHSGMAPYAYSEDKENFDWDTYNSVVETKYMLCTYSTDGTLISAVNVEELNEYCPENSYTFEQLFVKDGEIYLPLSTGYILHINKDDGSLKELFHFENIQEYEYIPIKLSRDRDGKYLMYYTRETDESNKATVLEFNLENGTCGTEVYAAENKNGEYAVIVDGYGDYRFCIQTTDSLTGYKYDGEKEELINWVASDVQPQSVQLIGDNFFVLQSWEETGMSFKRLTRKRQSEINEKIVLELMNLGWDDYDLTNIVNDFNRNNDDYRIDVLKNPAYNLDYEDENYEEAFEEANRDFTMKLLTDDAPDIVISPDYESIGNLCNKGAFTDLYTLMENDSEMNKSAFLPNVIEAMESENGALYCLPSSFSVNTLIVKSKFYNKENWTMQDMISVYDNAEKDVYKWIDRDRMMNLLLMGTDFVDEKKGTCSFDSPEFIELLNFCKRFPVELDQPAKNYDSPEQSEAYNQFNIDQFHSYQRDENLIYPLQLASSHSIGGGYSYPKALFNEDVTLVGYPSANGQGSKITTYNNFAITSNCEYKEAAWDFIKEFIKVNTAYIPIIEENFEATLDSWMTLPGAFAMGAENGYYEDDGLKVYPLTQEERDQIEEYIRNTTTFLPTEQTALNDIIYEEAEVFFADAQTAEAAAERIQKRAEILVSEQS